MSKLLGPPSELAGGVTFSVSAPKGDYARCTIVRTDAGIPMRYTRAAHHILEQCGAEVAWLSRIDTEELTQKGYDAWYRDDKGNEGPMRTFRDVGWNDVEIWQ